MVQFRHRLTDRPNAASSNRPTMVDRSFFREPSYHALSRQDAARWADLGTYRADQALRANRTAWRRARHRLWRRRWNAPLRPSPPTSRADRSWQGTLARTRCIEDQANACGIVLDVGFIGLLTRCRSGLTRMVATRGSSRRVSARSWPSLRPVPPDSLPRAQSSPASDVRVGTFTVRGCPAATDGFDGELARLHDRAPEGWHLLQSRAPGRMNRMRQGSGPGRRWGVYVRIASGSPPWNAQLW